MTIGALVPLLLLYMFSAPYRMARIMNFVHGGPEMGRQGKLSAAAGNHRLRQRRHLRASGRARAGNGTSFFPNRTETLCSRLSEKSTGLSGRCLSCSLFLVIMLRGMKIATSCAGRIRPVPRDRHRGSPITLYALINAGVTLGILPTTGLPMPFVSYGGSSMLFSSIALGVMLNISSQTDLRPRVSPE